MISYFVSLELLVDSTKGDGLINLGQNIEILTSKFSKMGYTKMFICAFSIFPTRFLNIVVGVRLDTMGSLSLI